MAKNKTYFQGIDQLANIVLRLPSLQLDHDILDIQRQLHLHAESD